MRRKAAVSFALSALSDLESVLAWYADRGVPEVGHRLVTELVAQAEMLAVHPEIGRIVPEFDVPGLRELLHPPFRIVYRHDHGRIRIVRVWRSERLLKLE